MRFIGDVHSHFNKYLELIGDAPASIQVGDFGFGFETEKNPLPTGLDPERHLILRGNHDDPAKAKLYPNYVGDIAVRDGIFFMSGARSIDFKQHEVGYNFWNDEELSFTGLNTAIDIYEQVKPRVVVSHACPTSIAKVLFKDTRDERTSRTTNALDTMFQIHKPHRWIFGHHHVHRDQVILGTRFVCVAMDSYRDIDI